MSLLVYGHFMPHEFRLAACDRGDVVGRVRAALVDLCGLVGGPSSRFEEIVPIGGWYSRATSCVDVGFAALVKEVCTPWVDPDVGAVAILAEERRNKGKHWRARIDPKRAFARDRCGRSALDYFVVGDGGVLGWGLRDEAEASP